MEALQGAIKNYLQQADSTIINIVVAALGFVIVVIVILICIPVVRHVFKKLSLEDKSIKLMEKNKDLENEQETICKNYEKSIAMFECVNQITHTINSLLCDYFLGDNEPDDIREKAEKIIQSIVYIIPQNFKINYRDFHRCFIWMVKDSDSKILENIYSSTGVMQPNLNLNNSFEGLIYITGEAKCSSNTRSESNNEKETKGRCANKSLIGVPIKIENKTIGVLTLDAKTENAFAKEKDITFLNMFASLVSVCLLLIAHISKPVASYSSDVDITYKKYANLNSDV